MGKQRRQCQTLFSKITADGDCCHEIKRCLLLGRKVMTNLDSTLKTRDIILPRMVRLVKAMFFPVVMYRCESWTVKKAERQRIDAFELWCWRRFLRVLWSEKCKSKPQWSTISRQSEWLLSKSLQPINAGEGMEKREPSYTAGGNANWYSHYGEQCGDSLKNWK